MTGAFDALFFPGCIDVLESGGIEGFLTGWGREARQTGGSSDCDCLPNQ